MPEIAEVMIMRDNLQHLVGKKLTDIFVFSNRYTFDQKDTVIGKKVISVQSNGKKLLIIFETLDNCLYPVIITGFGLTGKYTTNSTFTRFTLSFDDGFNLYYDDKLCYGRTKMELIIQREMDSYPERCDLIKGDKQDIELCVNSYLRYNQNKPIAQFLLNQNIIAGIGNYIRCDGLFLAKISPHRLIKSLSNEELFRVIDCCRQVAMESYQAGGSPHYGGNYQFKCYMRDSHDGQDGITITKEKLKGRTIYWSPEIQL